MRARDPAADVALRALAVAAREATPVCQRLPAEWWTDPAGDEQRAAAVDGCRSCPLLAACEVFADAEKPTGVVVAGRVWS